MTTTDVHPDQAAVDAALTTPQTVHWLTPEGRTGCMTDVPADTIVAHTFDALDRADNPCLSCVLAAAGEPAPGEGLKWTDLYGIDPTYPDPEGPRDPFADRVDLDDLRAQVEDVYAQAAVLRRVVAQATYYAAATWLFLLVGIVAANPDRPLRSAAGVGIVLATLAAAVTLAYHAPGNRRDHQ